LVKSNTNENKSMMYSILQLWRRFDHAAWAVFVTRRDSDISSLLVSILGKSPHYRSDIDFKSSVEEQFSL